jgi:RNA polymerase sigma factor (sigma-70 family)
MAEADVKRTIEAVWRIESARLIAGLARIVRDVGLAEDMAQEAFVAALEQWPESGLPERPGAWLMATAKHRAIDKMRRASLQELKTAELVRELERSGASDPTDPVAVLGDFIEDDLLRLIFTTCHPVLAADARVALTLRLLGGLTTAEIARAYLVPEATVAQRIVRAKKTLTAAHVPFEVPEPDELPERPSRSSRRFTSSSTRAIPRRGETPACGRSYWRRRFVSAASWLRSCLRRRRHTASFR